MNFLTNQKGYTLLLTLVIVVLLFLVTASFAVASMNQSKQIERTDDSFTATALAEMGFERSNKIIIKEFEAVFKDYENCLAQKNNNCSNKFHQNFSPELPQSQINIDSLNKSSYEVISFSKDSKDSDYRILVIKGSSRNNSRYISAKYFIPNSLDYSNSSEAILVDKIFDNNIPYAKSDDLDNIKNGDRLRFRPNESIESFKHIKKVNDVWIEANEIIASKFFALNGSLANINKLEFKFPSGSQNKIEGTTMKLGNLIFNDIPNSNSHKFEVTSDSKLCLSNLILKTTEIENDKGNKTEIITEKTIDTISDFKKFITVGNSSFVNIKLGSKYYLVTANDTSKEIQSNQFLENCKFSLPGEVDPLTKIEYTNSQSSN